MLDENSSNWKKLGESLSIENYVLLKGSNVAKCQQIISQWLINNGASETAKQLDEALQGELTSLYTNYTILSSYYNIVCQKCFIT